MGTSGASLIDSLDHHGEGEEAQPSAGFDLPSRSSNDGTTAASEATGARARERRGTRSRGQQVGEMEAGERPGRRGASRGASGAQPRARQGGMAGGMAPVPSATVEEREGKEKLRKTPWPTLNKLQNGPATSLAI